MGMKAPTNAGQPKPVLTDWQAVKDSILDRLDIAAEYEALDIHWSGPPRGKGWRPCFAVGRQDDTASAAVHLETGVYKDSGAGGKVLGFFDFALEYGTHGRWLDVIRHYADKAGVELGRVETATQGRVLESTYVYRDETGAARYGVFRWRLPNGRKRIQQARWTDNGWDRGRGCMEGVQPLPYRLSDVLAEPDKTVYVVEGEKDADRLARLGFVATTNHGGAESTDHTWPHFAHHFAGRSVVVVPDNDKAGRNHAARVAEILTEAGAAVRLLILPGLPEKGDASDWLDLGGTEDELASLAEAAPEWDASLVDVVDPSDRLATVADLRANLSSTPWLWPLWLPNAALAMLAAEPGTGKTRLVFDLMGRIYNAKQWPDGTPIGPELAGRPFLYIPADQHHQELCDLAAEFGLPDEAIVLNTTADDPLGGTELQDPADFLALRKNVEKLRPVAVVIDTITNSGEFAAQDSVDAKRQYKPLQRIAMECGVAVLAVSHLNVSGSVIGRRAVEKARVVLHLSQPDKEGQPNRRRFWVEKSKAIKPPALGLTMGTGSNVYDNAPPEAVEPDKGGKGKGGKSYSVGPAQYVQQAAAWMRERLAAGPLAVGELMDEAERVGHAKGFWKARDLLQVVQTENSRGRKYFELPPTAEAASKVF